MVDAVDIPLARPFLTEAEIEAVVAVLRTPNLSIGPKVVEFEEDFAAYCGTRHAVACSSGTAALHMLMIAAGIGPGDEVITTPFSFVASANCILMVGATPVFADIDPATWNIRPDLIEAAITPRSRAIIPVDVFGTIPDMDAIREIARRHRLMVFEDSCEALGSEYKGQKAGSLGDAGVFGFYPNKQITTGEGGMVTTDNETIADVCRSLRNQGRDASGGWLAHQRLGYNFRMSDINAALGLAQLGRIEEIIAARCDVNLQYCAEFPSGTCDGGGDARGGKPKPIRQVAHQHGRTSWFVFVVRLGDQYNQADRDRILTELRARGIGCNNYFAPIHLQPFYGERFGFKPGDFPACEHVAARTIALPFHHELTKNDVERVCRELFALL
jgi:dTDP-4-amino-4,6-dideoxygalactose transaminase